MAKPFSALPRALKKRGDQVDSVVNAIVRNVARGIGATLVDTTRVDTGVARSNWRASLNMALRGTIPAYSPGNKLGKGETGNASATKAQQTQVINMFLNKVDVRGIFIANNVRYIGELNDGRPGLAPGLMMEQAIQTGRAIFRNTKVSLV